MNSWRVFEGSGATCNTFEKHTLMEREVWSYTSLGSTSGRIYRRPVPTAS